MLERLASKVFVFVAFALFLYASLGLAWCAAFALTTIGHFAVAPVKAVFRKKKQK